MASPVSSQISVRILMIYFSSCSSELSGNKICTETAVGLTLFAARSPADLITAYFTCAGAFPLTEALLQTKSLSSDTSSELLSSHAAFPVEFLFTFWICFFTERFQIVCVTLPVRITLSLDQIWNHHRCNHCNNNHQNNN